MFARKRSSKHEAPTDRGGPYSKSVVQLKKWSTNPAFKGRPRWNPELAELIKRYLTSQTKNGFSNKRNGYNFFVGTFNEISKHSKRVANPVGKETFYVKPRSKVKNYSLRKGKESTSHRIKKMYSSLRKSQKSAIRKPRHRLKSLVKLKSEDRIVNNRDRRDIAAIAFTAGEQHDVIDPFDVNNGLLKWEHSQLGILGHYAKEDSGPIEYRGYYSPLYHNRLGKAHHSVVNTNSVGYSGDLFGHDITSGWYRKKRSLRKEGNRRKRSSYDKDFEDYDMDSYARLSDSKYNFDSYSHPHKEAFGRSSMDEGLLHPLDSPGYYGMLYPRQRSKKGTYSKKKYRNPSGKYFGHTDLDFAFDSPRKKTHFKNTLDYNFPDFSDPMVSSSIYGVYPKNKKQHSDYYDQSIYQFGNTFKHGDRVIDTDYNALHYIPVGGTGFVNTGQTSSSSVSDSARAVPPAVMDPAPSPPVEQPATVAEDVVTAGPITTLPPSTVATRNTEPPTTAALVPDTTTQQVKIICCKSCGYKHTHACHPDKEVTTTPCYKKHGHEQTTKSTPHYHHGHYPHGNVNYDRSTLPQTTQNKPHYHNRHLGNNNERSTLPPYQASTPKSIWSEFEIIGNVDSWLGTTQAPWNKYNHGPTLVDHKHKYIGDNRGRTSPRPYITTPTSEILSRIVTEAPGAYKYNYVQDIDIKVQHHPEGKPRITGTVELQQDGEQNPRFVVKLPFATGKLPLSIRKLVISRFTPSPLDSGKSATADAADLHCDSWNTTCLQEYAERMGLQGDVDIIAEVDPTLLDNDIDLGKDHISDLRDAEERRKALEEEIEFTPEILPEIGSDRKVSEIHSSVPVQDSFLTNSLWEDLHSPDVADQVNGKGVNEEYQPNWMSKTTASPLRLKLNSLPAETPHWLRNIITKFIESTENVATKDSEEHRPQKMMQTSSGQTVENNMSTLFSLFITFIAVRIALIPV